MKSDATKPRNGVEELTLDFGRPNLTKHDEKSKKNNELGKVTKYGTSRPLFSWRNGCLKKVWADLAPPPALIGLNLRVKENEFWLIIGWESY